MNTQLYPGIAFSPQAALVDNIGAADTVIKVTDASAFPERPNLATIGTDETGETVLYAAKTADALSNCMRGVEGTARAWTAGELIGRNFTAKDHTDLIAAVLENRSAAASAREEAAAAESVATDAQAAANAARSTADNAVTAADAAQATADAKQNKLTGQPGQVVGFGGDGSAAAVQGWSNPNLLINADFRAPVNRNGETEYTGGRYTIDRWYSYEGTVSVQPGVGIKVISFIQPIENIAQLLNRKAGGINAREFL